MSTPNIPWMPAASIELLKKRAQIMSQIREFFTNRAYLEVETPIMGQFPVTDIYLENIEATFRKKTYYLHTSPEYAMKRLLAAGSGPIFQLTKVFRDDELGRWHNPEFTLLEWYQLDIDHHALMEEVDLFLQQVMQTKPLIKISYQDIFSKVLNINPLTATIQEFQDLLNQHDLGRVLKPCEEDRDQYLFLIMSHLIEPALAKETAPVAIYHFPPSQASLSKIENGLAERFEVFYKGIELANGFHELTNAALQTARFEIELKQRKQLGLKSLEVDKHFLAALDYGLPSCSGVALGVDRMIALRLKQTNMSSVLSFDISRA